MFDEAYFDEHSKKNENLEEDGKIPFKDHLPIRMPNINPSNYNLISIGPKGGTSFNPDGVLNYLSAIGIVYDKGLAYQFDGRIYAPRTAREVRNIVYRAIRSTGSTFVPSKTEIANVTEAAMAVLEPPCGQFPDPDVGILYDTEDLPLIPFSNGILNMSTGNFLPFTEYLFITSYLHARYDPGYARNGEAKDILMGIIPEQDTQDFFLEMCGFFFYSDKMYPPAIFNLYGPAQTGKSALQIWISEILEGAIARVGPKQLTARFTVAELEGKRLNICGETGDASSKVTGFDGELLKQLTGGEQVLVERKNVDPFYMVNTAKFLFCTNTVPDFGDTSSGLYRRLYVVPCRVAQDPTKMIHDILKTEESKTWLVMTALYYYQLFLDNHRKFTVSQAMLTELAQYKSQDGILDFISQVFDTTEVSAVAHRIIEHPVYQNLTEFYEAYCVYSKENGSRPMSSKKFHERVRSEYRLKVKKKSIAIEFGDDVRHTTKNVWTL